MKEFLFIIWDVGSDTSKLVKVSANTIVEAKDKFAKAFCPLVDFGFSDIEYMTENQDIRIYCSEYKDVINLV